MAGSIPAYLQRTRHKHTAHNMIESDSTAHKRLSEGFARSLIIHSYCAEFAPIAQKKPLYA